MDGLGNLNITTSGSIDDIETFDKIKNKKDSNKNGLGNIIKIISSDPDVKIPIKTYGGVRG